MNVRNGAQTLREAIASVLAQTSQDWELIVWDDRSTDNSAAIAAEYRDARIHYYLSPEDVALGKARADAIRQAGGEWIAFLDQDDVWMPHKLESQLALAQGDVGLIYGRTVRFYPSGFERDYDHAHEYKPLPEGDIFSQLFTDSCFIAMSSAMFRRSAIESVGGIPGGDSNHSRLLPLRRGRAQVSRTRRAGSRLPLSHARRQHVPYRGSGDASRGALAYRSMGWPA